MICKLSFGYNYTPTGMGKILKPVSQYKYFTDRFVDHFMPTNEHLEAYSYHTVRPSVRPSVHPSPIMSEFGICMHLGMTKYHALFLGRCFFANVSLKFSNINNRLVTSAHVAILLSFVQRIEEYLLAKKLLIIPDPKDINSQLRQN